MDLNFGINGAITAQAARPIVVKSSTVIAILGVVGAGKDAFHGLHKFNNADDAQAYLKTNTITGDVVNALKAIALQGVNCPIVLNLTSAANKLIACDLFKKSEGLTGISLFGGLLIAPVLSADTALGTKLVALAKVLQASAIIDNFDDTEAKVTAWAANFGTDAALLTHGKYTADGVTVTASALYAGVIALCDAKPWGWAKSHSNRVVQGVSAAERVVEYLDGSEVKTDMNVGQRFEQEDESDLNFLNRLAKEHDAVFNIKNNTIYFMKKGGEVPSITLDINQCLSSDITYSNKTIYKSCKAIYHNTKLNKKSEVTAGNGKPQLVKRGQWQNDDEALLAAKNALTRANKSKINGNLTTRGQVIFAGSKLLLGNDVLEVTKVTHNLSKGWKTSLEFRDFTAELA